MKGWSIDYDLRFFEFDLSLDATHYMKQIFPEDIANLFEGSKTEVANVFMEKLDG